MINFCILIPCYNESKNIGTLIKKLKDTYYPFIFINDGSTDNTGTLLAKNCKEFIGTCENQGKGKAIKVGVTEYKDFEYYLIMDSDGQHATEDIPNFIKMAEKYPDIAIFIGNRLRNRSKFPFIRYYTNVFMSWVISLMIGQKVDSQCGFRLIRKDVFDLDLQENRFAFETEMLVKAYRKGLKIKSVPIHTIYHKGRISKIKPIQDTIKWIKLLWRLK